MIKNTNIQVVASALIRMYIEGGEGNILIITGNEERNYYIQFAGSRGEPFLMCEAVGNKYLLPEHELDHPQIDRLTQMGWEQNPDDPSANLQMVCEVSNDRDRIHLGEKVLQAFNEVYGLAPDCDLDVDIILE